MKNYNAIYLVTFLIPIFLITSCRSTAYLPTPKEVGINVYGSKLKMETKQGAKIVGELIVIDKTDIYLLTREKKRKGEGNIVRVPRHSIKTYSLHWGEPVEAYYWMPLILSVLSVSHGRFAIFSIPVNLIGTLTVIATAERDYRYSEKDIKMDDLSMFARFPAGFPEGVGPKDIRY